ncbi:MAG: hypothetical protein ACXWC9_00175 [Pseudobdellovibrionaceae bacterium]
MKQTEKYSFLGLGSPRRLRNVLLFPKIQFKYANITAAALVVAMLMILFNQRIAQQQVYNLLGEAQITPELDAIFRYQMIANLGIAVLSIVCIFCLSIVISHRFLGPSVGILNYLKKLKSQGSIASKDAPVVSPLTQRSYDGLPHLTQFINSHEITVREKLNPETANEK